MDPRQVTRDELSRKGANITAKTALVGLDGFVDKIIHPVAKRTGQGDNFEPIPTISDFAARIQAAAGKSTNIELFPLMEKLGGNGPIMANALAACGIQTQYIGALGRPEVHPVFKTFATKTNAISIADPGITHALEFQDGKILLGTMASLDEITLARVIEIMGEGRFSDALSRADLLAMVNWTMIPNMTALLNGLLDRVLPNLGPRENRLFFFDLADPEKRSDSDIRNVLHTIARFQNHGHATLGLNLKEAQHIHRVIGKNPIAADPNGLRQMATDILRELKIGTVVIHPTDGAACANRHDAWYVPGPYTAKPRITTGAGDHFNAGFMTGQLLGLTPPAALTLGTAFSGSYVRTAQSPTLSDADTLIRDWQ